MGREQGKNIFSIPGQINNSIAEGTNYLIKNNLAKMAISAEEIVGSNQIFQENLFESLDLVENEIIKFLKIESLSIDDLSKKLNKSVVEIGIKIGMMSLHNIIFEENGKIYLSNQR
jgi:predicted Rossmann fold nucleotide-binding protein DprA/Smf involved in DNA uptake